MAPRDRYSSPLVESAWLEEQLQNENLRIFDTTSFLIPVPGAPYHIKSGIEEFQREHIPGSLNNYYRNLVDPDTGAFLDPADLRERFSTLGVFEKDRVISYCGGGIASTVTSLALRLAGHQAVAVYDRSLPEWTADPNLPLEW